MKRQSFHSKCTMRKKHMQKGCFSVCDGHYIALLFSAIVSLSVLTTLTTQYSILSLSVCDNASSQLRVISYFSNFINRLQGIIRSVRKQRELCEYGDLVDLRVIVLACNRPDALSMLLDSLDRLVLDGASASLEIWIDRDKNGTVHNATSHVAHSFSWSRGVTRVHVWPRHVGIYGQWINTWCPTMSSMSSEMALILEEDLVVSPFAWRWLRAARKEYGNRTDVAGYSLQSENVYMAARHGLLPTYRKHVAFAYRLLGTWGFAPHPVRWAEFRSWFFEVQINNTLMTSNNTFRPYVDKIKMTDWYKVFEKERRADSMWSMWFIYFANQHTIYTIYNNIAKYLNETGGFLSYHSSQFGGMHYRLKLNRSINMQTLRNENGRKLLHRWKDVFIRFPTKILKFEFNATSSPF